jgi:hypothetical protein
MATSYLSPGVYVEEVDRGSKPIEAVGTNTVGFLGESAKGPLNEAVLITNWSQFVKTFGDFKDCSEHLAHAIYGFFNNGGSRCFVVNVGAPEGVKVETKKDDKKDEKAPQQVGGGGRDGLFIGRDGGPGARTGLKCLDEIDEIAIIAAPGQTSPAVQDALLSHAETRKDRFAVLDSPESISGGVDKLPKPRDSKYGAYYFPWIQVYDPEKGNIFVPPSGHIAGVYSRVDSERGVHKAPANEIVRGALGLKYNVSKGEQDLLNPKGINAIRTMQGGGIRIWGARTLSSDASWKYINVRRLFIMIEQSIMQGMQWAVFEPNDHTLWKKLTRDVRAYLMRVWSSGALFGQNPDEAFYVKCDDETNPRYLIDAGQVNVQIGLCPVKPAEFVIFSIGQWDGGGLISE